MNGGGGKDDYFTLKSHYLNCIMLKLHVRSLLACVPNGFHAGNMQDICCFVSPHGPKHKKSCIVSHMQMFANCRLHMCIGH